jgi:hypothetical protein
VLQLTSSPSRLRRPRWAPARAALLGIAVIGAAAGCRPPPREALARYSGIRPCAAASVRYLESPADADDVLRYALAADARGCAPDLPRSVAEASRDSAGRDCARLLAGAGVCGYSYGPYSVTVQRMPPRSAGGARFEVRSW